MSEKENPLALKTLRQIAQTERYASVFTESSLRALLLAARPRLNSSGQSVPGNGLYESGAIIRIGRRIFVDPVAFDDWVASKRLN